jgi:HPt (histidine-containing phosphotransfer) domain-containing protein
LGRKVRSPPILTTLNCDGRTGDAGVVRSMLNAGLLGKYANQELAKGLMREATVEAANVGGGRSGPPDLPIWDETVAVERAAGNAALARKVVASLIASLPAEVADLHRCAERNDPVALAESTHHLHGATCCCGVLALNAALQRLEQIAEAGDAAEIRAALARVDAEVARLTAAFA